MIEKKYLWYGSKPLEFDLGLQENDVFFRPRGKLIWGCPIENQNNWKSFMFSVNLPNDDSFISERIARCKFCYEFEISDYSKILLVSKTIPLPGKYILGFKEFDTGQGIVQSYLIDFTLIMKDGYSGFELDFEGFGGIPIVYLPWSVSSIVVWDSRILKNVTKVK